MGKKKTDQELYEEMKKAEMGRPRIDYTHEKGVEIAHLISQGWSLRRLCALDGMPSTTAFFRWLAKEEDFRKQYDKAKKEQAQNLFDEIFTIADTIDGDYEISDDGKIKCNTDNIQRARLRVDVRKWALSKMDPKKYGDRVALAGDEDSPIVTKEITANDQQALHRYIKSIKTD